MSEKIENENSRETGNVSFEVEKDVTGKPVRITIFTNHDLKSEKEAFKLPLEAIWTRNILDPHPWYTGTSRITLLDKIHYSLQNHDNNPTVVHAMDGMGKTELARMYLKKYGSHYKYRVWVNSCTNHHLQSSFYNLAQHHLDLSLKHQDGKTKKFDVLLQEIYLLLFKTRAHSFDAHRGSLMPKNTLLIFDDADPATLKDFLPPSTSFASDEVKPAILITSSQQNWSQDHYSLLQLKEFDSEDISEYLESHVEEIRRRSVSQSHHAIGHNIFDYQVKELERISSGLPLALAQIVRYINQKDEEYTSGILRMQKSYGVSQFLRSFKAGKILMNQVPNRNPRSVDEDDDDDKTETVVIVWDVLLKKIVKSKSKVSELAIEMLKSMQVMSSAGIPKGLIYSLFPKLEVSDINEALSLLFKFSAIREHDNEYLCMHRVFQSLGIPMDQQSEMFQVISGKDVPSQLKHYILRLIKDEKYREQVLKTGSLWFINFLQLYHHLSAWTKENQSISHSKTMYWSHNGYNDNCTSKGCPAYSVFTVLLGGLIAKELFHVLHQFISQSQTLSSQWQSSINFNLNYINSGKTDARKLREYYDHILLAEISLLISQIPNPPIRLMMNCLSVIGLANDLHGQQTEGLKLFFKSFKEFLVECKKVEFPFQEIISPFEAIVGAGVGVGGSDKDGGKGGKKIGCASVFSQGGLKGESYKKLGDWVEKVGDFLRESKDENNALNFPNEFVEATEAFLLTICAKENKDEDFYTWVRWQFYVLKLVEKDFPENQRVMELLEQVTKLYQAMKAGKVLNDDELFPTSFPIQHQSPLASMLPSPYGNSDVIQL